jgi:hypothetical protein
MVGFDGGAVVVVSIIVIAAVAATVATAGRLLRMWSITPR